MSVRRWLSRGGSAERERRRREVDAEIEAHLALRQEALEQAGLSAEEARAEALRRFGDLDEGRRGITASASARDRSLGLAAWLDDRRADILLALRRARRSPGYTILAGGTLALGVGLTTASFAVVDGVLLRDLPYEAADRVVELWSVTKDGVAFGSVSEETWLDWRERNRTFESTALFSRGKSTLTRDGETIWVSRAAVTAAFFDVLRPPFLRGRGFDAQEVSSNAAVAVVSERFWREVMGGAALPATIELGNERREVVGVVAAGAEYPAGTRVWIPHVARRSGITGAHNWISFSAVARLASGVLLPQVEQDLGAVAAGIRERHPEAVYAWGVGVVPLREAIVADFGGRIRILFGASALVLLIACINLAGLGVVRSAVRSREFAVRSALGASRRKLVRQLLTEYLLLGLASGAVGIALAWLAVRFALDAAGSFIPRAEQVGLNGGVLLFTLAACIGTAVLAGVLPALRAGAQAVERVAGWSRSEVGGAFRRGGAGLVAVQVALAVTLLIGVGLLVRSLAVLLDRDVGFDPDGVLVAEVALTTPRYWADAGGGRAGAGPGLRLAYWDRALESLRALPGVEAVGMSTSIPTGIAAAGFIEVEGVGDAGGAGYRAVSPGYFAALRIPVLSGRAFGPEDGPSTPRVVLVNQTMAREQWGRDDPIGKRIRAVSMEGQGDPDRAEWLTVIGVVGDVRQWGYERDPQAEMYVLYEQVPYWTGASNIAIRAAGSGGPYEGVRAAVRSTLVGLDPALPLEIATLDSRMGDWTRVRRFLTGLLAGFAGVALAMALVGVYGLLAFVVAQRTREMGVRAALGATRFSIVSLVVSQGAAVAAAGALAGTIASVWLTKLLGSLLVEVTPTDPATFATAAFLILAAAVAAATVPALRAARVDPRVSLEETA